MSSKELAILIAVNREQYAPTYEEADRADIGRHRRYAEEKGAVYWGIPSAGYGTPQWLKNVRTGYFYEAMENAVTYRFDITEIKQWHEFSEEERKQEEKYVFGSRLESIWKHCVEYYEDETKCRNMVWIKISNIDPLSKPRMLNEFRKALTNMGDSVKLVRSYAIVLDPGYT